MLDTMTITKVLGSLFGALLVFLLGGWAGSLLFATGGGHGAHAAQSYVIETAAAESDGAAPAEQVDFAQLVASADAGAGEKVFGKCKSCHKVDGTDGTGPHLNGVVGRDVGTAAGFGYSDALHGLGGQWTPERLDEFLASPKDYAPGTKMGFAGLKKVEDRAAVVAYLSSLN